jgi:transcriptional regulator with XRE-family HTH domain
VASYDGEYIASGKSRRSGRREWQSMTEMTVDDAEADAMRISSKLRHARRLRRLTLKEVADKADCSESLLSKIENGRASPSLKMLQRLASALGLTVGQLFAQGGHSGNVVMRAATRSRFATGPDGQGDEVEPLAPHAAGDLLECHLYHFAPGSSSGGNFQHQGEEFGFVLEGELELIVSGRKHIAKAGDSFCFRSEKPHSWSNKGKKAARVLWINTPPTF